MLFIFNNIFNLNYNNKIKTLDDHGKVFISGEAIKNYVDPIILGQSQGTIKTKNVKIIKNTLSVHCY